MKEDETNYSRNEVNLELARVDIEGVASKWRVAVMDVQVCKARLHFS